MKIEFEIKDIERDEVVGAIAGQLLTEWVTEHDDDTGGEVQYARRSAMAEALRRAVIARIDSIAAEVVRAGFDSVIKDRITAAVDGVLAEGWQETNNYGESKGARLDLKARIGKLLTETRGDGYSRQQPSVLDAAVSAATNGFLSKELQPVIDAAKANLKKCLDATVMKTVADTITNAVGLR